jgi:hypothetical protein
MREYVEGINALKNDAKCPQKTLDKYLIALQSMKQEVGEIEEHPFDDDDESKEKQTQKRLVHYAAVISSVSYDGSSEVISAGIKAILKLKKELFMAFLGDKVLEPIDKWGIASIACEKITTGIKALKSDNSFDPSKIAKYESELNDFISETDKLNLSDDEKKQAVYKFEDVDKGSNFYSTDEPTIAIEQELLKKTASSISLAKTVANKAQEKLNGFGALGKMAGGALGMGVDVLQEGKGKSKEEVAEIAKSKVHAQVQSKLGSAGPLAGTFGSILGDVKSDLMSKNDDAGTEKESDADISVPDDSEDIAEALKKAADKANAEMQKQAEKQAPGAGYQVKAQQMKSQVADIGQQMKDKLTHSMDGLGGLGKKFGGLGKVGGLFGKKK